MGQRIIKVTGALLHQLLKLPADCHVTGLSWHLHFGEDAYAIRVASPEFIGPEEGCQIPDVGATYRVVDGKPEFAGWTGNDAAQPESTCVAEEASADEPVVLEGSR